uniref:Uncharacterized protein n=1 Tax=Panagrolaimus davidi TaxID=227884 RepID=A0A914QJR9_9BILA
MSRSGTEFEGAVHLLDLESCLKINEVAEDFAGTPLYASVAAMENKMLGFKDDFDVFGEVDAKKTKEDTIFVKLAKILRYIDSLKREDIPDYERIHYVLQCAFKICIETGNADDDDETLVKKLNEFSRGGVQVPAPDNVVFFSSINYSNVEAPYRQSCCRN